MTGYWTTRVILGVIGMVLLIAMGITGLATGLWLLSIGGTIAGWALVIWLFATETGK